MMTELERVGLWNTTAGKPCGCSNGEDELMANQITYVIEETEELYKAHRRKLEHSLLDACGDVLVTAGGVLHLLGAKSFQKLPESAESTDDVDTLVDDLYLLTQELKPDPLQLTRNPDKRIPLHSIANMAIGHICDILIQKGYNPEEILQIVNDSNFSKFCKKPLEAKASRHAYIKKKRYVNVDYKKVGKYRVLYGDDVLYGTKQKTLKSIMFKEPDFIEVIRRVNPQLLEEK